MIYILLYRMWYRKFGKYCQYLIAIITKFEMVYQMRFLSNICHKCKILGRQTSGISPRANSIEQNSNNEKKNTLKLNWIKLTLVCVCFFSYHFASEICSSNMKQSQRKRKKDDLTDSVIQAWKKKNLNGWFHPLESFLFSWMLFRSHDRLLNG